MLHVTGGDGRSSDLADQVRGLCIEFSTYFAMWSNGRVRRRSLSTQEVKSRCHKILEGRLCGMPSNDVGRTSHDQHAGVNKKKGKEDNARVRTLFVLGTRTVFERNHGGSGAFPSELFTLTSVPCWRSNPASHFEQPKACCQISNGLSCFLSLPSTSAPRSIGRRVI